MSPMNLLKSFIVVVVLGFLAISEGAEARVVNLDGHQQQQNFIQPQLDQTNTFLKLATQHQEVSAVSNNVAANQQQPNLDESDSDEDLDEDDVATLAGQQLPALMLAAGNQNEQQTQYLGAGNIDSNVGSNQPQNVVSSTDLKPAASKHYHHKHGAKGWLDMGAWTGKKGAFGWYDKHPVGKGK